MTEFNLGDNVIFCKDTPMQSFGYVSRKIPKGVSFARHWNNIENIVEVGPSLIINFTEGPMINSPERYRPFIETYFTKEK